MKKFLKILFLLIIVLVAACPFGVGYMLEKQYNDMIAQLNTAYQKDIVFTGKFQRRYMGSTATTELSVNSMPVETLQHIVHHGPVIFNFSGWLNPASYVPRGYGLAKVDTQLTGTIAQKLLRVYSGKTAYIINTIIAFNGNSTTNFINYPLTTQVGVGILKWQGANGNIEIDKNITKISGSMVMPSLEYSEPVQSGPKSETVQISNLKLEFNKLIASGSNMFNIALDSFKILNKTTEELSITNLTFVLNKSEIDKIESAELKAAFAKLHIANHYVGPFALNAKMSNINSVAIMTMLQTGKNIPPQMRNEQLVAMLSARPTLDSDMKVTMPDGKIDYTGHIEAGGAGITSGDPAAIIPTIKMSQKLQIGSKIVTKLMIRYIEQQIHNNEKMYFLSNQTSTIKNPWTMTPAQLQTLAEQLTANIIKVLKTKQYIVEQNDIMSCDIEFANSVFTVNGVPHTKEDLEQLRVIIEVKTPASPLVSVPDVEPVQPVAEPVQPVAEPVEPMKTE